MGTGPIRHSSRHWEDGDIMARATRPRRVLRCAGLHLVIFVANAWPRRLAASQSHAPQDVVLAGRLGSRTTALRALEPASSPLAFTALSFHRTQFHHTQFARRQGSPWAAPDTPVRRDAGNSSDDAGASGSLNSSSVETGEQEGGGGDGGEGEDEEADGDGDGEAVGEEEAEGGRQFFAMPASFEAVASLLPTRPSLLTSLTQASPSDQRLLEDEVEGDFGRLWVWLRREGTNGTEGNETSTGGGQEGGGGDAPPDENDGCGVEDCIPTNNTVSVTLPYYAETFTSELQSKFTIAVAKVADVQQAKVTITTIAASGASRRQATITVTFVVTAPSKVAATNVTLALRDKLNTELVPLGVEPISAIWVHAENFCPGAIQRNTCKNIGEIANGAEYLRRCVWDGNCGTLTSPRLPPCPPRLAFVCTCRCAHC
jgi:hypothetical protein